MIQDSRAVSQPLGKLPSFFSSLVFCQVSELKQFGEASTKRESHHKRNSEDVPSFHNVCVPLFVSRPGAPSLGTTSWWQLLPAHSGPRATSLLGSPSCLEHTMPANTNSFAGLFPNPVCCTVTQRGGLVELGRPERLGGGDKGRRLLWPIRSGTGTRSHTTGCSHCISLSEQY